MCPIVVLNSVLRQVSVIMPGRAPRLAGFCRPGASWRGKAARKRRLAGPRDGGGKGRDRGGDLVVGQVAVAEHESRLAAPDLVPGDADHPDAEPGRMPLHGVTVEAGAEPHD